MFKINAADFVCYLKDALVPPGIEGWERVSAEQTRKPGIHIRLDCRLADYSKEKGERRSAFVHFILCGNTNTFAWHTTKYGALDLREFENISNHDSCWRGAIDTYLSKLYFAWAKEVNDDKAPRDLSQHCFIGRNEHRLVIVTYGPDQDPDRPYGSRYKLISLEDR